MLVLLLAASFSSYFVFALRLNLACQALIKLNGRKRAVKRPPFRWFLKPLVVPTSGTRTSPPPYSSAPLPCCTPRFLPSLRGNGFDSDSDSTWDSDSEECSICRTFATHVWHLLSSRTRCLVSTNGQNLTYKHKQEETGECVLYIYKYLVCVYIAQLKEQRESRRRRRCRCHWRLTRLGNKLSYLAIHKHFGTTLEILIAGSWEIFKRIDQHLKYKPK